MVGITGEISGIAVSAIMLTCASGVSGQASRQSRNSKTALGRMLGYIRGEGT